MRVLVLLACLLLAAPAQARIYSQPELDALVAPIALYPDSLVSQILMAATYPEDVAEAARWSRANSQYRGEDAVRAAQGEPWDPSVKSLLAFPEILARMEESPQWTRDLGAAFLQQEPHVMDTVQALRRRAQATGNLQNGDNSVRSDGQAIVIEPAQPHIVYLRYYDPYVVYGPWWWPAYRPVFWRPWYARPVFVSGVFFGGFDWHRRHATIVRRPVHVHHTHVHVAPGRWQHRSVPRHVTAQPYHRVPESKRQPIINSAPQGFRPAMPAASGFSPGTRPEGRREARRDQRTERPQPRIEQRAQPRVEQRAQRAQRLEPQRAQRSEQRQQQHRGERGGRG